MLTNLLQPFLEDTGVFPSNVFGLRSHLSTQYILLQIKQDILERISRMTTQAALALKIEGAFDNVSHMVVLENLASTGCGPQMYDYVRDFLSDRTATIGVELIRTGPIPVPSNGTPQGLVL